MPEPPSGPVRAGAQAPEPPQQAPAALVLPAAPSLPRLVGIVARSAILPGWGHLSLGRRRSGRLILAASLLVLAGLVAAVVFALRSPDTAASWTVRPRLLMALRWTALGVGAAWVGVIMRSAVLARPGTRGAAGRLVAGATSLALAAVVLLPAVEVTRYADVQRDFVTKVFHKSATAQAAGAGEAGATSLSVRGRLNVLLIGSDAGPDRRGVRTDTIVLASTDTRTGRTVLFTLPRNLERAPFAPGSVMAREFPRGFSCRSVCLLNAVYQWGVDHADLFPGDPTPGITALESAVSATLGLYIDDYALVDLAGFERLVDALGGVTIRVERRLPIGGLDADGNHVRPSGHVEAGLQHMSGATALAYARSRSDSSDYERVLRQRCLIGALQRQSEPRNLLANFSKVADSTADALQTDIPRQQLPDLVKLAFQVKSRPIESLPFTPPLIDVTEPDIAKIHGLVQAALVPPPPASPAPGPVTPPPGPTPPAAPAPGASPPPSSTPVAVDQVCAYS